MPTKFTQLDDQSVRELNRLFKKVDSLSGPDVCNSKDTIVIKRPPRTSRATQKKGSGACKCQYQGMVCGAITNNTSGCFFPMFAPSIALS